MIRFFRMVVKVTTPILFLGGAVAAAYYLVLNPPSPERSEAEETATLVEVYTAQANDHPVVVSNIGEVMPAREVSIHPQITGRLVEISPNLVPGGTFAKGDVIARIETRDYEYMVEQREADVERARLQLKEEQGRQVTAEREWNLLGSEVETNEIGRELALRKPFLKNAEASLEAALSRLNEARLALERTVLRAPFNSFVMDETVDVGQLVSPQTAIVQLAGSDQFWINVKIPYDELAWLNIPGFNAETGSVATVLRDTRGPDPIQYRGRILRLLGQMNQTKMAQLLIGVDDPLKLDGTMQSLPLLLGDIVRVHLEGRILTDVISIPRIALRESATGNDNVWVMDSNNRLSIRDVEIIHRREDDVLVSAGVQEGDEIVTSRIGVPLPGMLLRTTAPAPESRTRSLSASPPDEADTDPSEVTP